MIETIQKVIDDGPEKFDIERIHDYINRGLIKNQKENENSPHPVSYTHLTLPTTPYV